MQETPKTAWLAGTLTLLLARRYRDLVPFLFCCALLVLGSYAVLGYFLCPCTGGVGLALTAVFIALDAGAIYVAWRFARSLRSSSRRS